MDTQSEKEDLQSRLHKTAEAMSDRLASLQGEVSSTGLSLQRWIVRNPLKSVGGMLVAGLAVGALFGGGNRSKRRKKHAELIDAYLKALRDEVEEAVDHGEEPGSAVDKALRDRVPLIVYSGRNETKRRDAGWSRFFLQEAVEILFSTGLSLLARRVIESVLDDIDIDALVEEYIPREESV